MIVAYAKIMPLLTFELGGSKRQLFAGTGDGKVLERQTVEIDRAGGGERIRTRIKEIIIALQPTSPWLTVGVVYGGSAARKTGRLCTSHRLPAWRMRT